MDNQIDLTAIQPEAVIGAVVRIFTTLQDEFEAEIFNVDPKTNTVILKEGGSEAKRNYRIINLDCIAKVQTITPAPVGQPVEQLPVANMAKIRAREEAKLRAAYEESMKIGIGVSLDAQILFNALSKTLPCRWDGETIIVMEDVRVAPPYDEENCSGGHTAAELNRVKRVLVGEKQKLAKSS